MKFVYRFCMILIAVVLLSACQSTSNVLFSDDFSNINQNWDKVKDDTMTTDYYNNAYRIMVNKTNYDAWANPDDLSFTDVQVEVDATKNSGPDYNDFGIICRYTNSKSFYYGVVSTDGYYAIFKKTKEGGKPIGQANEEFTDKVTKGTNHLRFDCIGSTLTLYVNGTLIDKQTDADYKTGNVGLIAGTYTETGTDILFDNIFVYKP